jgi:hypothetical protein
MKEPKSICVIVFLILIAVSTAVSANAEDIRIVAPYLGYVNNVYENADYSLDLDDSSLMKGLYFQWINPKRFQWNTFLYQSSDINYSTLWGGHFIFDLYLGVRERGKYVIGSGIEYIRLDMDAGNEIIPLSDFQLVNNIVVPYLRAGRYFLFGSDTISVSVLPWAGIQPEWVRGDISFNFGGPFPPPVDQKIEEYDLFGIAGINASVSIFHFITVDAKYRGTFNADEYFSSVDSMVNVFFTRHWGLSYRFKYSETTSGSTSYHIGGIAYVF